MSQAWCLHLPHLHTHGDNKTHHIHNHRCHHHFKASCGHKQSPIDVKPSETKFDKELANETFELTYNPRDITAIVNSGHTFQLTASDKAESTMETWTNSSVCCWSNGRKYGHLQHPYVLMQTHFHWGTNDHDGSEHTIAGRGYAGELHIVHRNAEKTVEEAVNHKDGLAVLGIFLEAKASSEPTAFDELLPFLHKITYKDIKCDMPNGFDLTKLLPRNKAFWTYDGSLTTPPCSECVRWTLFREPIPISHKQLDIFRSLFADKACDCHTNEHHISKNTRPCQSCSGRTVRASFPS